ncbi:MAG: hypothetical protein ACTSXJ_00345 [Candidatus Baldrarchaeia archaeon]
MSIRAPVIVVERNARRSFSLSDMYEHNAVGIVPIEIIVERRAYHIGAPYF